MPWVLALLVSQSAFSAGDLLARYHVRRAGGFEAGMVITWWFAGYTLLRAAGTIAQLYVLSRVQLGASAAAFSSAALVLAPVLGLLVLREQLSWQAYGGITLAVAAVWVVALGR